MKPDEITQIGAEPANPTRRRLLQGVAGSAGAMLAAPMLSAEGVTDPTRVQGGGPTVVGARSPFEQPQRLTASGIVSFTPLQDLHGSITPADLHFERHHAGIPALTPDHELVVHGMVDRPLTFSLNDLKRFPAVTRICFVECAGNYFPRAQDLSTPQMVCGLTSQSEWTGVPLATLLREAGVHTKASWLIAEGSDAAVLSRSIPIAKALDDALVVFAQNGEALRPGQGYPIRLLLPGWEGNTNVKWLRRIELTDAPAMSREETSKYTEPQRDGSIRQFSFELGARSMITTPAHPYTVERGFNEIRGLAWSGRGRIDRVEVSTDNGRNWLPAQLQGPVLPKAHTRFALPWRWDGSETVLLSRAIDEHGFTQPTLKRLLEVRGPGAGPYHFNPVCGWRVRGDGEVRFHETA